MYVLGFGFLPQHSLVAAIDGSQFQLYYLPAGGDTATLNAALQHFLTEECTKPRVLCVHQAATLVQFSAVVRKYAKQIHAVVVFDTANELAAHRLPVVDGTRTDTGWWRKPQVTAETISDRLAHHHDTLKLSKLHRRRSPPTVPVVKTRGCLGKFAVTVTTAVDRPKRATRLLRALFGRLVGTVSATDAKRALQELHRRYHLATAVLDELARYQCSPKGLALRRVFFRMQRGDDFRELQIRHKHLDLNDWLVVNDYWPAVEKHSIKTRPTH